MVIIFTLELYFNISWARLINNCEKYSQEILILHHLIYLERLYYLQNAFIQMYYFTNVVPELIQYFKMLYVQWGNKELTYTFTS